MSEYAKLPLSFELNRGQTDSKVQFLSRGNGYMLFLTSSEAVLALQKPSRGSHPNRIQDLPVSAKPEDTKTEAPMVLKMKLIGADPGAQAEGLEELPGKSNYFIGNDPAQWRTDDPTYGRVRYRDIYPGVDLVYYGNQSELEHDFVVAPGVNPGIIEFAFDGSDQIAIDINGDLKVHFRGGEVRVQRPRVYQGPADAKQFIPGRYVLKENLDFGFQVTEYDRTKPLVIDPVLSYSTYLGGSDADYPFSIAVDGTGNAYVTGNTSSIDFPMLNPLPPGSGGSGKLIFVAKLNATGSALVYSTYLGCSATVFDAAGSVAVDGAGSAYLTGRTDCATFPTTVGAFDTTFNGAVDAFVTKLSPGGNELVYSTYIGGSGEEDDEKIAIDTLGNAYVTGSTSSTDFPRANAAQPTYGGGIFDVFVTKLNAAGSTLLYSTYLGGSNVEQSFAIAADNAGNAYVTGYTISNDFKTASPLQTACILDNFFRCHDAFVAKFTPTGSLVYSTYLGGDGLGDYGRGVAADSAGNAYVTGTTDSTNFPKVNAFQSTYGGNGDVFVSKIDSTGSSLVYSTYLGGSGVDDARGGIAVDASGNVYVAGGTSSINFPVANPLQSTLNGGADAVITKFNALGSGLVFSTYLGGSAAEQASAIAIDSTGNVYVTGNTNSSDFPTSGGAFQTSLRGSSDAFVVKVCPDSSCGAPPPAITSIFPTSGTQGQTITNFTVNGSNFQPNASILSFSGSGITVNSYSSRTAIQIIANITVAANATTNMRDVIVKNTDGQQGVLTNGFSIFAPQVPDLAVTKTADSTTVASGATITYTISTQNIGSGNAVGSTIVDTLPAGVTFQKCSVPCTVQNNMVTVATTDTLPPGQGESFQIVVTAPTVQTPTPITNTVSVSTTGETNLTNNQARVDVTVNPPPPTCTLSANPPTITQGQSSILTWTTTNNPTAASIDNNFGSVNPPTGGSAGVALTTTMKFTLTVTNAGGTGTCSASVTVKPKVGLDPRQDIIAEPVSTGSGNYYYQHTDFVIPGRGQPLVFQRTYNALDSYAGPLGAHWTHSYNVILNQASSSVVVIKWGDGHDEMFTLAGGTYIPQPGVFSTLVKIADGSFVLTQKDQTRYNFLTTGKLASIQDKNGNTVGLTYDVTGNLVQVINAGGRSLTFLYDASNRLARITDPIGRTVSFSYDTLNNLTQAVDPAGGATTFSYDGNHRVQRIDQPNGQVLLENTYDGSGRVVSQRNGRGFTTAFAYGTPNAGDSRITDARGNQAIHTYDALLRITKITDAQGGTTSITYDANNDRTSVSNANGRMTTFSYDAHGSVTTITDPLGNIILFTYDSTNNLLLARNAKGNTTTFTYDANSNLMLIRDPLGNATSFGYGTFGELTSKTDARGNTTSYAYDASGNLQRITDASGNATTLNYDGTGRLISITDANGHTATAIYDALSRLTRIADPLGNQTQFAYDAIGNLVRITDANGNVTHYAYDAANNLASVTDALGNITRYAYDENNNRGSFTNAKGNITGYTYDALNRLSAIIDPLSFVTSYTYDVVGNVVRIIDAKGQTNQFAYDALNRLVIINYADGKNVAYTYDGNGNRLSMVDSNGTTTYAYDNLDRLLSVTHPDGKVVSYGSNAVGSRNSVTYPDGKVVGYTYDKVNRLSQVKDWADRITRYEYDAAGNLTKTAYPNDATIAFNYDAANRLIRVLNNYQGSGNGPISSFAYNLDRVGNRIHVTDGAGGGIVYTYDDLNQLLAVAAGGNITRYAYDEVGNRVSLTEPGSTLRVSYDAADRLLEISETKGQNGKVDITQLGYDANGNQVSKTAGGTTLAYGFDAANRLVSVIGGGINSTFGYDGDGNRIRQAVSGGSYTYLNDVATALPVVLQESGPDGNLSYAYGLGLLSESGPGFDFFYQYDGLGSVVGLTDVASRLNARYTYDAWGEADKTIAEPIIGTRNKFRFTGEALDPDTGLYYLRARYYDWSIGRFSSKDPFVGFAGEPAAHLNRYAYAGSNPVNNIDPSGLWFGSDLWNLTKTSAQIGISAIGLSGTNIVKGTVDFANFVTGNKYGPLRDIGNALSEGQQGYSLQLVEGVSKVNASNLTFTEQVAISATVVRVVEVSGAVLAIPDVITSVRHIGDLQRLIDINSLVGRSILKPSFSQLGTIIDALQSTFDASTLLNRVLK